MKFTYWTHVVYDLSVQKPAWKITFCPGVLVIAIFNPNKTYSYEKYMKLVIFQKYARQKYI